MKAHKTHSKVLDNFMKEFGAIFDDSEQAMYLYLDDNHKTCNTKFAKMLGYKSVADWAKVNDNFLESFVEVKSQRPLVHAFRRAMEKYAGSTISVTWKAKSGRKIHTRVILVPVARDKHLMALHFVE